MNKEQHDVYTGSGENVETSATHFTSTTPD